MSLLSGIFNVFNHSFPVENLEDIEIAAKQPPLWVDRIEPLRKRSKTVIANKLNDCHVAENSFVVKDRIDRRTAPKTLLCHDYKGGYLEDKYLYSENENVKGNSYTFYNWSQIDYFVYFSHNLITIPPLAWINIGHRNGVKVLGTIITEFAEGEKIMSDVLRTPETMQRFCSDVAEIMSIFKIDGWLLNIENNVKNIDRLKEFVEFFTICVHGNKNDAVVIWYDSVLDTGILSWQNELNHKNKCFFDCCDGIFLNYCWDEQKLKQSKQLAEHRNLDVFVGIDVFGRNTFGGGQFNSYKAAKVIREYNLSIALFAPGWTHEQVNLELGSNPNNLQHYDHFIHRDYAFWNMLWPYLYTHPISQPFITNFEIGLDREHFNLFRQQIQLSKVLQPNKAIEIKNGFGNSLRGVCHCLEYSFFDNRILPKLSIQHLPKSVKYVQRLFSCDIPVLKNLTIFCITKAEGFYPSKLNLILLLSGSNGTTRKVKLLCDHKKELLNNASVMEINPSEDFNVIGHIKRKFEKVLKMETYLKVYSLKSFQVLDSRIMEIGGVLEEGHSIHLYGFGMVTDDSDFWSPKFQ